MTDEETIRRAHRISSELGEIQAAFDDVRASLIKEWAETASEDGAAREKLFMKVSALDDVRQLLQGRIDTGRIAIAHAERLNS